MSGVESYNANKLHQYGSAFARNSVLLGSVPTQTEPDHVITIN
jgi:hypothetical protein